MTVATRIRAEAQGDRTTVRGLVSHPMESGQRKDEQGAIVPAWFIRSVAVTHNGRAVLSAQWGPSVSKNPLVNFRFVGGKPGDKVVVSWVDNRGDRRSDEAIIQAS